MIPPARIDVILARRARVGIVFRHGPSHWVLPLRWDTASDTFTPGEWFRGRIYSRRCDLTPDGKHLVYFAAKFSSHRQRELNFGYSWTAISVAPSLDPIGLWVKDHCWFGGGLFSTDHDVELNERPDTMTDERRQHRFRVKWNESASGEDEPIYGRRMERDGWVTVQSLRVEFAKGRGGFVTNVPQILTKAGPRLKMSGGPQHRVLEASRSIVRYESIRTFTIIDEHGARFELDGVEWADWDQRGRLVVARAGTIATASITTDSSDYETLADLNALSPQTGR